MAGLRVSGGASGILQDVELQRGKGTSEELELDAGKDWGHAEDVELQRGKGTSEELELDAGKDWGHAEDSEASDSGASTASASSSASCGRWARPCPGASLVAEALVAERSPPESPEEFAAYAMLTCCYFWYRSQGAPTFTPAPFGLSLNDLWGAVFAVAFVVTRRRSYLVYAINPWRNLVLVGLQTLIPRLAERAFFPEYARNVLSAALQLSAALLALRLTAPRPICEGRHSEWYAGPLPFVRADSGMHQMLSNLFTALLVATGVLLSARAFWTHTDHASQIFTATHAMKISLSVFLGVSEEVTWRQAYLEDNNNILQAFTWGMNHFVVGEGMSNPYAYGFVAGAYALILGLTMHREARYFSHSSIEYSVMNNLVKPRGDIVWQMIPERRVLLDGIVAAAASI